MSSASEKIDKGMKVAIVGSRDYPRLDQVRRYIRELPEFTTIISGGARGVDCEAENAAREHGLEVQVLPAEWNKYGRRAGILRNAEIVSLADLVVAFWDGKSRGTKNSIDHARNQCKPFVVVFP